MMAQVLILHRLKEFTVYVPLSPNVATIENPYVPGALDSLTENS